MFRKLLLMWVVTFVDGERLQIYLSLWVMVIALTLHYVCHPYNFAVGNFLESGTLLVHMLNLNMSLLWTAQEGLPPPPRQPTPGVVKQDKSSGGSVDTTKTRSGPQRVRMSSGERPIGAAKGTQLNTEALCQPPPPPPRPAPLLGDPPPPPPALKQLSRRPVGGICVGGRVGLGAFHRLTQRGLLKRRCRWCFCAIAATHGPPFLFVLHRLSFCCFSSSSTTPRRGQSMHGLKYVQKIFSGKIMQIFLKGG